MDNHFAGIVPEERWKNDVLNELRQIRQLLERDVQPVKEEPIKDNKRPYNRRVK